MQREVVPLGIAAVVVVLSIAAAATLPGALAEHEDPEPRGFLDIREVTIAPGAVSGQTATLSIEARLTHRRGPSNNVTVLYRAVDAQSGLLEASREVSVGTVTEDRELAVVGNLSVEREGSYRIRTVVFQDGARVAERTTEVRGVGTLQPAYARTTVGFHRFAESGADLPVIEYSIADVTGNRTTLQVSAALTNAGDTRAGGLRLELTARQADSNIVADRETVEVGQIAPGETATPTTELTVADGYNYYLDAVLWKDGVIVGTARSAANLNPTERLRVNETRREIGLQVGDFEDGVSTKAPTRERTPTPMPEATAAGGQPGFTVISAILAVAAMAMAGRYWRRSQ